MMNSATIGFVQVIWNGGSINSIFYIFDYVILPPLQPISLIQFFIFAETTF